MPRDTDGKHSLSPVDRCRLAAAMAAGYGIALGMVLIGVALLPPGSFAWDSHDSSTGIARRWGGGCGGWTPTLAVLHLVGDLMQWFGYVVISLSIIRLHPMVAAVRYSSFTVPLIIAVFLFCGGTHLFDAYAMFHSVYWLEGWYKILAGIVALAGSFFIAHNLVSSFARVAEKKRYVEQLERELVSKWRP